MDEGVLELFLLCEIDIFLLKATWHYSLGCLIFCFFKKDENTCHACVKLLEKEVKISPKIYIFWKNNANYSVFIDLHCNYAENIFLREPIIGKNGNIYSKKLNIHFNRLLNYD